MSRNIFKMMFFFCMIFCVWMDHGYGVPAKKNLQPSQKNQQEEDDSPAQQEKMLLEQTKAKLKSCEKKWNDGHQIEFIYSDACHGQLYSMVLGESGMDEIGFLDCEVKVWGLKNAKRLFLDCHEDKLPDLMSQAFPNQSAGAPIDAILSSCQILSYESSGKEPLAKDEKNPRKVYYHYLNMKVTPACYEALVNHRYNLEREEKIKGCRAGILYPFFRSFAKKTNTEEEEGKEGKEELGLWCTNKQSIVPILKKLTPQIMTPKNK